MIIKCKFYRIISINIIMKSEQTQILLQKKQKKTKLGSKIIPQRQNLMNFESEKRIQSNPILIKLQQKTLASLQKKQLQYKEALERNGLKQDLIQKLMIYHRIKNNMMIRMFNNAYDKSKNPYEKDRVFHQNISQIQINETSNQNNITEHQLDQNEDSFVNLFNFNSVNTQSIISTQMKMINNQTQSEICMQCRYNNSYPKFFKYHQYKNIFSENQRQLLEALVEHYKLLTYWLIKHGNRFKHVIQHFDVRDEIPYKLTTPKEGQQWLKRYDTTFAILMEKGQNEIEYSSILSRIQQFQINRYLFQQKQGNAMDYLIEVVEGLNQLIQHKIYHIDIKSDNYIPVHNKLGITVFKFIDFQYALYLGDDHQLRSNVRLIWMQIKKSFEAGKIPFLKNLFYYLLCPPCQLVKLKEVSLKPGEDLFKRFSNCENQDYFVEYLKCYSLDYYRDRLMIIWKQISFDFMPTFSQKIQKNIHSTSFETLIVQLERINMEIKNL